jgi:hypothetical protein
MCFCNWLSRCFHSYSQRGVVFLFLTLPSFPFHKPYFGSVYCPMLAVVILSMIYHGKTICTFDMLLLARLSLYISSKPSTRVNHAKRVFPLRRGQEFPCLQQQILHVAIFQLSVRKRKSMSILFSVILPSADRCAQN